MLGEMNVFVIFCHLSTNTDRVDTDRCLDLTNIIVDLFEFFLAWMPVDLHQLNKLMLFLTFHKILIE